MAEATLDLDRGFTLGAWRIEPLAGCFKKPGHTVHVEPKVMDVLLCLVRADGETVTRQQLLEQVWQGVVVGEEVLTRAISELRSLLGDTAREKSYVRTIPKRGYSLIPRAAAPADAVASDEILASASAAAKQQSSKAPRWWQTLGTGQSVLLGLLVVGGLALLFKALTVGESPIVALDAWGAEGPASQEPLLGEPDPAGAVRTIAVLPFVNLSGIEAQEYFADGISEDIRGALIAIPSVKVVARASSQVFKGRAQDVREIGRALNADALVEGTVRLSEDQVRVTVQLTSVESGFPMWAASYDRELADVFAIQQQIAEEVAVKLELELSPSADDSSRVVNTAAYEQYLLGRHQWHRRTKTSLAAAIRHFQDAIALQPDYALAYTGLADAYSLSSVYADLDLSEALPIARQHMREAMRLNPRLAEAHAAKGMILELEMKTKQSRRAYERAVQLKPSYSMAHMWLGNVLMQLKELDLAHKHYSLALDRDPLHPQIQSNYLSMLSAMGRYQEVIDLGEQFYEQSKSESLLKQQLMAYGDAGRYEELLAFALRYNFSADYQDYIAGMLINGLIRLGRIEPARELLQQQPPTFEPWLRARLDMAFALQTGDADEIFVLADKIEALPAEDMVKKGAKCAAKATGNYARAEYWRGMGHYLKANYTQAADNLSRAQAQGEDCWMDPDIELSVLLYRVDVAQILGRAAEASALLQELETSLEEILDKGWGHQGLRLSQLSYYILSERLTAVEASAQQMAREGLQPWGIIGLDPFFQRRLATDENLSAVFEPLRLSFDQQRNSSERLQLAKFGL